MTDPRKPPSKLAEYAMPILAIALLILGLTFAKGAVFALRPLLKFAIPGGVAFFAWKWVKKKFMQVAGAQIRTKIDDVMRQAGMSGGGPGPTGGAGPMGAGRAGAAPHEPAQVIDLCPKCGAYLAPGHKCAKA